MSASARAAERVSAEAVERQLREALSAAAWRDKYTEKATNLMEKVVDSAAEGAKLSKGAGGNVSGLRGRQARTQRLAVLLRAAAEGGEAGAALVHGSVALTWHLEENKNALRSLVHGNDVRMFNIQSHPWVDMEHNQTMKAFHVWNENRLGIAMENKLLQPHGGVMPKSKRKEAELKAEHRLLLRARMRRDVLTTLCVTVRDSELAVSLFGTDYVVLSAMCYRLMPDDIESQIQSSGMGTQAILDIVTKGREKYEAYYTTPEGLHAPRRMRTLPSNLTFSYFDQATYFENTLLPRIAEVLDWRPQQQRGSGASAVRHVFRIERDTDENHCQRAFGHWLLKEFREAFGAKFCEAYKRHIVGHVHSERIRLLFADLLRQVDEILADYAAALDCLERSRGGGTKTESDVSTAAPPPPTSTVPVDDTKPVDAYLKKGEKHTALDVLGNMQAVKRKREQQRLSGSKRRRLPLPNAAVWRQPFDSTVAPLPASAAAVPAAVSLARRTGVLDELARKCLRRTPLEVSVGAMVVNTATNATTANVSAKTKAARIAAASAVSGAAAAVAAAEVEEEAKRDVGVASRRMINATAFKPIVRKDFIQHTDARGQMPVELSTKERTCFLVEECDVEATGGVPRTADDVLQLRVHRSNTDRVRFANAFFHMPLSVARTVATALQQSRTPARTDSETDAALMRSDLVRRATLNFVDCVVSLYAVAHSLDEKKPKRRRAK